MTNKAVTLHSYSKTTSASSKNLKVTGQIQVKAENHRCVEKSLSHHSNQSVGPMDPKENTKHGKPSNLLNVHPLAFTMSRSAQGLSVYLPLSPSASLSPSLSLTHSLTLSLTRVKRPYRQTRMAIINPGLQSKYCNHRNQKVGLIKHTPLHRFVCSICLGIDKQTNKWINKYTMRK